MDILFKSLGKFMNKKYHDLMEQNFDYTDLDCLTSEDLEEVGIGNETHRRKILSRINLLVFPGSWVQFDFEGQWRTGIVTEVEDTVATISSQGETIKLDIRSGSISKLITDGDEGTVTGSIAEPSLCMEKLDPIPHRHASDYTAKQIFVKMLVTGDIKTIDVEPNYTIADVKAKIHNVTGISAEEQRLVFAGEDLENGKTLSDYNIKNQNTIFYFPQRPSRLRCSKIPIEYPSSPNLQSSDVSDHHAIPAELEVDLVHADKLPDMYLERAEDALSSFEANAAYEREEPCVKPGIGGGIAFEHQRLGKSLGADEEGSESTDYEEFAEDGFVWTKRVSGTYSGYNRSITKPEASKPALSTADDEENASSAGPEEKPPGSEDSTRRMKELTELNSTAVEFRPGRMAHECEQSGARLGSASRARPSRGRSYAIGRGRGRGRGRGHAYRQDNSYCRGGGWGRGGTWESAPGSDARQKEERGESGAGAEQKVETDTTSVCSSTASGEIPFVAPFKTGDYVIVKDEKVKAKIKGLHYRIERKVNGEDVEEWRHGGSVAWKEKHYVRGDNYVLSLGTEVIVDKNMEKPFAGLINAVQYKIEKPDGVNMLLKADELQECIQEEDKFIGVEKVADCDGDSSLKYSFVYIPNGSDEVIKGNEKFESAEEAAMARDRLLDRLNISSQRNFRVDTLQVGEEVYQRGRRCTVREIFADGRVATRIRENVQVVRRDEIEQHPILERIPQKVDESDSIELYLKAEKYQQVKVLGRQSNYVQIELKDSYETPYVYYKELSLFAREEDEKAEEAKEQAARLRLDLAFDELQRIPKNLYALNKVLKTCYEELNINFSTMQKWIAEKGLCLKDFKTYGENLESILRRNPSKRVPTLAASEFRFVSMCLIKWRLS